MGFCINCIYHKEIAQQSLHSKERHVCLNKAYEEYDYITGKAFNPNCYLKNNFEECLYFDDGYSDKTYYAWTNGERIIYTISENPDVDDVYYTNLEDLEPVEISNITYFLAWENSGNNVYTDVSENVISENIFNRNGEIIGVAEDAGDETVTYDRLEYIRNSENDFVIIIIDEDKFYRDENSDVTVREQGVKEV